MNGYRLGQLRGLGNERLGKWHVGGWGNSVCWGNGTRHGFSMVGGSTCRLGTGDLDSSAANFQAMSFLAASGDPTD